MKKNIHTSPFRTYRRPAGGAGEFSFQVQVAESDLWVTALAEGNAGLPQLMQAELLRLRAGLEGWILRCPEFLTSLEPLPMPGRAAAASPVSGSPAAASPVSGSPAAASPVSGRSAAASPVSGSLTVASPVSASPVEGRPMELIRRMYAGSELLGVGPMAAVAGAVAQGMAEAFVGRSPELLVENGGDIYIYSSRPRQIGLLPDPEKGVLIGLALPASVFPCSVCSSSATIGHSLSFGRGELATVVARDAAVADAAATAFCNRLRKAGDINRVLEQAKSLQKHGLTGVFLQCGGSMGLWGDFELSVMGA